LVRQVTIDCPERGLLLLKVRDEILMTIAAFQALNESSVAFGVRKSLQAEHGKADMEKIADLENEKRDLQRVLNKQKAQCKAIERAEEEKWENMEKKHADEIQLLKRSNQNLKGCMEEIPVWIDK